MTMPIYQMLMTDTPIATHTELVAPKNPLARNTGQNRHNTPLAKSAVAAKSHSLIGGTLRAPPFRD